MSKILIYLVKFIFYSKYVYSDNEKLYEILLNIFCMAYK